MTHWTKTMALALELPFDANQNQIWEKLIKRHPKYTEFFITASTTIDILKIPHIGYSMLRWYESYKDIEENERKNFTNVNIEFIKEFRRRMVIEFTSFTKEDKKIFLENYDRYKDKLNSINDPYKTFKQCLEFFSNVDIEIEELINQEEGDADI